MISLATTKIKIFMIEVTTPCRLHFGLLAYNPDEDRQFGGLGMMVQQPCIRIRVQLADQFQAVGPESDRAIAFAKTFLQESQVQTQVKGVRIEVLDIPRAHTGLGTGTQLGMAVARGMAELTGQGNLGVNELAHLVKRGQRSAIGAHGFFHGGLIVEGGKRRPGSLSPMLVQQPFPQDWRVLLMAAKSLVGLDGSLERQAFAKMPPVPRQVTAELCRLVMLGLLPAVIERDLDTFGKSLHELQQRVGACFKSSQGGIYAAPLLDDIVRFIRSHGAQGVGQSSWGPTLYAIVENDAAAESLAGAVRDAFDLDDEEVLVTRPDNQGCRVSHIRNHADTEMDEDGDRNANANKDVNAGDD